MRSICFLITGLAMALSTPVQAADSQGNYAIWGMGNSSCHSYNKARAADEADGFRYFIMGYLTAYNVHQQDTYSISSTQPMPDIMTWFDEFCDSHAVHSFENALKNFISEKYDGRMKAMPTTNPYGR